VEPNFVYPNPLADAGLKPPLQGTTAGTQSLQAFADSRSLSASGCEHQVVGLDSTEANSGAIR
jgi:hypothetical protein